MRQIPHTLQRRLSSVALQASHPLVSRQAIRMPSEPQQRIAWQIDVPHTQPSGKMPDSPVARLEAVLFVAREPLTTRKLAQLADLADGTEARTLIRALEARYEGQQTAFQIAEVAGGFQLLTRPRFGPWLRRLYESPVQARLSGPALETLAVVAYRQPVLRADIEEIRGVQSGEILRQLMDRDLVRISGRSSELGRPFFYGTTRRFLQVFGLRKLDELPRVESFSSSLLAPAAPNSMTHPAEAGRPEILSTSQSEEESHVKIRALPDLVSDEMLETPVAIWDPCWPAALGAKDGDDDDDFEEEDDDEADDDEEDDDLEDDDLEEDEWEEVDDDLDEEEFDEDDEWDEEDDWDDDDEDDDDDEEWEDDAE
jgi:segregation and condensation protein B